MPDPSATDALWQDIAHNLGILFDRGSTADYELARLRRCKLRQASWEHEIARYRNYWRTNVHQDRSEAAHQIVKAMELFHA